MNPSHPRISPFLSHPLSALLSSLIYSSAQLSLLNLIRLLSSQPLDLFTSTSLPSFLKMKTSLWTMLDRLRRQPSSDLNLSLSWLLPMKAFTMEKMVWFTKLTVLFSLECGWVGGVCWVVVLFKKKKKSARV